jgi:hypothetical protein
VEPKPSLTAEQALSQLTDGRKRQRRIEAARASGVRSILYGVLALGGSAILAYLVPPSLWLVVPVLGALGGITVAVGALRLLAAQALARRS